VELDALSRFRRPRPWDEMRHAKRGSEVVRLHWGPEHLELVHRGFLVPIRGSAEEKDCRETSQQLLDGVREIPTR
jgi:hypothetical protein